MTDPAPLDVSPARPRMRQSVSPVWVVPLVALAVTLLIAWNAYNERGRIIRITFEDATGITPGQTQLRFREVHVGTVEKTGFTEDLSQVVVSLRVNDDVADLIDAEARFWVVRPEVTTQGITRLDTVLSGVFIEGTWDAEPGEAQSDFTGEPRQPSDVGRVPGTVVTLRVNDAEGLADGMPVLYRGLRAGTVQNIRLREGGDGVLADARIDSPYDARLSSASVFWDTSGFSVSIGSQGVALNVRSLAALIQGGVEFTTPISGGVPIGADASFRLFEDEREARDSIFTSAEGIEVTVAIYLDGAVRGLAQGAPVNYQSLPVGQVNNLSVAFVPQDSGPPLAVQRAILTLSPARMGLPADTTRDQMLDFLADQAARGLRARAASTGLLGTTLVVEMLPIVDAVPQAFNRTAAPYPVFPTAPAAITSGQETAEGLFARLNSLPIEGVLSAATSFLNNASALVSSPELRETPGAVRGLIEDARGLLGSEQIQAVPEAVQQTLGEIRALTAQLRASGVDEKLAAALDGVTDAAGTVNAAAEGVPELVASIQAVAREAAAVRFQELGDRAAALMAQLESVAGESALRETPGRVNETLAELSQLLQSLREGGAAGSITATLQSAQAAADGVARASADLPALTARLNDVVRNLDAAIASYGDRSTFNSEALSALRELRRTAASVGSLAKTIERNPRALLTGR